MDPEASIPIASVPSSDRYYSSDEESSLSQRYRALGQSRKRHENEVTENSAPGSNEHTLININDIPAIDHRTDDYRGTSTTTESAAFSGYNDLSFLQDVHSGCAALLVLDPEHGSQNITGLDMELINDRCSGLAARFTSISSGTDLTHPDVEQTLCCDMTAEPISAVIAVLRWIYADDYAFCEAMINTPVPLLFHLSILRLAQKLGAYDLEHSALMHVEAETTLAVETKQPIKDLCEAIRFLYTELREGDGLRNMVASYVIQNLEVHLDANGEVLRQTIFQSPLLHQDLTRANYDNNFKSTQAAIIIQMPTCGHNIHKLQGVTHDFTCEFHMEVTQASPESASTSGAQPVNSSSTIPFAETMDTSVRLPPIQLSLRRKFSSDGDADDEQFSPHSAQERTRPTGRSSACDETASDVARHGSSLSIQQQLPYDEDGNIQKFTSDRTNPDSSAPRSSANLSGRTTALMNEMRYNARMSVDGYFTKTALDGITKPKLQKQQEAAKSALTALLKGSSPYSRDSDEGSESTAAPTTEHGGGYEIIDLSDEDEWEMVQKA